MAQNTPRSGMDGNQSLLIGGLVCIVLGISWGAYEILRPRTADEIKDLQEAEKLRKDIERQNAKRGP